MKSISIIVPIYNAEAYLAMCIDSIIGQTLTNLEIILVDDGSQDASLSICKAYEAKDARIRVVTQSNSGVSAARNKGMSLATGEYLGFVDPDDWIEPEMFEQMYNRIREEAYPICMSNYYKDDKRSSILKRLKIKPTTQALNKEEVIEHIIANMVGSEGFFRSYHYIMGCVWRCLYKRSFIEAHHITFNTEVKVMEDLVFNIQALLKSEGLTLTKGAWYHYIQNPKSVLHTYNVTMWENHNTVHSLLEKYLVEANLDMQLRKRLDTRYIGMIFDSIYNEMNRNNEVTLTHRFKKVKEICKTEKVKVTLSPKNQKIKQEK